jgi:hypothetical protein
MINMYIIHEAETLTVVEDILSKGILPASETGNHTWSWISNPYLIYMSLSQFDRIGKESAYVFTWGTYGLVLNDRWVREHAEQFMDNTDKTNPDYEAALRRYGITKKNDTCMKSRDRVPECVVSIKPIPAEGIDLLVIDDRYDEDNIKDKLPRHMGLYLWNGMFSEPAVTVVKEPQNHH